MCSDARGCFGQQRVVTQRAIFRSMTQTGCVHVFAKKLRVAGPRNDGPFGRVERTSLNGVVLRRSGHRVVAPPVKVAVSLKTRNRVFYANNEECA